MYSSCGQTVNPIWLEEDKKNGVLSWEVQYTFGDNWRVSIFKFIIDPTVEEPTVKFISENPSLQYVSGLCQL